MHRCIGLFTFGNILYFNHLNHGEKANFQYLSVHCQNKSYKKVTKLYLFKTVPFLLVGFIFVPLWEYNTLKLTLSGYNIIP